MLKFCLQTTFGDVKKKNAGNRIFKIPSFAGTKTRIDGRMTTFHVSFTFP